MAKLVFRYGTMGSSKSANLQMVAYNYRERGMNPIILKPEIEDRDKEGDIPFSEKTIRSRIGLESKIHDSVEHFIHLVDEDEVEFGDIDIILVDESQFLNPDMIDSLAEIVDYWDTTVICYGLRTDFRGKFFPGSCRLMELADNIEEIPTICWCGRKARFTARIMNGQVVKKGRLIEFGENESYVPLCRKHFESGQLKPAREILKDWLGEDFI